MKKAIHASAYTSLTLLCTLQFVDPSTTSENLFALLNGDDIYNTYQEMSKASFSAWIFSKVYIHQSHWFEYPQRHFFSSLFQLFLTLIN